MLRLSAWISVVLTLTISLHVGAEENNRPVRDIIPKPIIQTHEKPRPTVLVLPARTNPGSEVDSSAIDVLLTSGLEDLGVKVVDKRKKQRSCRKGAPKMDKARSSYLDMDLEIALDQADEVRKNQLNAHGDLLGCSDLTEAELFMVQVLLDLGRKKEATMLAEQILARQPLRRLDPAKYTPAMLALWDDVVRRKASMNLTEPDSERLSEVGREAGVEWVVMGTCAGSGQGEDRLSVLVVPVDREGPAARHIVTLGTEGQWATSVRAALATQFPPPPDETSSADEPAMPIANTASKKDTKKKWYKSWWFWTAVGAVVVGGTAGAVGGYYANQNDGPSDMTMNSPW
ncbi:MAG: hypothetical protein GY854_13555 [Deltaproteobacteria bacterium]|nr:hypothetical protein [Deltaproteobacteria bacterium]